LTQRKCLQLWGDHEFARAVRKMARRLFRSDEDREDAISEAWERLQRCPVNLPKAEYRKIAWRAIDARYRRMLRRRRHEIPVADPKPTRVHITSDATPANVR
jgi:DNA-directed RNA polymerase specialized sigma24 family protein